jgi:ribonuclease P protein component
MMTAGEEPHNSPTRLVTLKDRHDFQAVRKGRRWSGPAFVLEAQERAVSPGTEPLRQPRFGFTVTRRLGGAVERNRIRRRLKAAVKVVQMQHARQDFDYVVIARRLALDAAFDELIGDLVKALDRVHRPPAAHKTSMARRDTGRRQR